MAESIFDYIFGENRFKRGDSGSDPTDYGLLKQTTQPDYLKEGVDYMAKGMPIMWDTLKDIQVLGGTSEPSRVAENYMRRWRGEDIIPPTEPKFISNYRNKVENMPVAPYTGKGDFQGVLGSTEAEKYDGYSGSDLTDYDISGENISNADRFGAQSVLGALEMINRPIESGETLSNVAVGGLANLTGVDIDPYYQEIASEMGKELAKDFDSWEAWNKSIYEQPDVPAMVLGGATYGGIKMLQLYKTNPKFQNAIKESFENAKNPGLSIKDISARNDAPTVPRDDLGFYSASQQLINDLPQEVNTPGDVQRYLIKRGVTRGELEETGLLQFFKDKTENGERVTKTELQNAIENSRLQSKEVYLGGASANNNVLDDPYADDTPDVSQGNEFPDGVNYNALRYWEVDDGMKDWYGDKHQQILDVARNDGIQDSPEKYFIKSALNEYNPDKYPLRENTGRYGAPEGDWLDKIVKNLDEGNDLDGLDEDLVYDYQNAIEKRAIDNYYENPIFEWNLEEGARVVGRDGDYTYIAPNGEEFPNIATDLNEVEVFLRRQLVGRNPNENVGNTVFSNPNWRQPGVNRDYEEILLTGTTSEIRPNYDDGPGVSNTFALKPTEYTGSHWGRSVPNPYSSIRTTRRYDVDGEPLMFVEEVQSDWHQRGRQLGFLTQERKAEISENHKKAIPLEKEKNKLQTEENEINYEIGGLSYDISQFQKNNEIKSRVVHNVSPNRTNLREFPIEDLEGGIHIVPKKYEHHPGPPSIWTSNDGKLLQYDQILAEYEPNTFFKNYSVAQHRPLELSDSMKKIVDLEIKRDKLSEKRDAITTERVKLTNQIIDLVSPKDLPNAPFKGDRWIENTVNRSVQIANERGLDKIAFPNRDMILDIWNKERRLNKDGKVEFYELYDNLYNKKIPSMLKKLENKYGGKFKMEKMKFGDDYREVPTFEITPDYKRKVDKTGIPLASTGGLLSIDQMQDDDKMNNKQGLLA